VSRSYLTDRNSVSVLNSLAAPDRENTSKQPFLLVIDRDALAQCGALSFGFAYAPSNNLKSSFYSLSRHRITGITHIDSCIITPLCNNATLFIMKMQQCNSTRHEWIGFRQVLAIAVGFCRIFLGRVSRRPFWRGQCRGGQAVSA
jgi:hypothetical protein